MANLCGVFIPLIIAYITSALIVSEDTVLDIENSYNFPVTIEKAVYLAFIDGRNHIFNDNVTVEGGLYFGELIGPYFTPGLVVNFAGPDSSLYVEGTMVIDDRNATSLLSSTIDSGEFINTGQSMFVATEGSVFTISSYKTIINTGRMIYLFTGGSFAGTLNINSRGGIQTINKGTICITNSVWQSQVTLTGGGCVVVKEGSVLALTSPTVGQQTIYLADSTSILVLGPTSESEEFHIVGFGGNNIIGVTFSITRWDYDSNGNLNLYGGPFDTILVSCHIGSNYRKDLFHVIGDFVNFGFEQSLNQAAISYSDPAPSTYLINQCSNCDEIPWLSVERQLTSSTSSQTTHSKMTSSSTTGVLPRLSHSASKSLSLEITYSNSNYASQAHSTTDTKSHGMSSSDRHASLTSDYIDTNFDHSNSFTLRSTTSQYMHSESLGSLVAPLSGSYSSTKSTLRTSHNTGGMQSTRDSKVVYSNSKDGSSTLVSGYVSFTENTVYTRRSTGAIKSSTTTQGVYSNSSVTLGTGSYSLSEITGHPGQGKHSSNQASPGTLGSETHSPSKSTAHTSLGTGAIPSSTDSQGMHLNKPSSSGTLGSETHSPSKSTAHTGLSTGAIHSSTDSQGMHSSNQASSGTLGSQTHSPSKSTAHTSLSTGAIPSSTESQGMHLNKPSSSGTLGSDTYSPSKSTAHTSLDTGAIPSSTESQGMHLNKPSSSGTLGSETHSPSKSTAHTGVSAGAIHSSTESQGKHLNKPSSSGTRNSGSSSTNNENPYTSQITGTMRDSTISQSWYSISGSSSSSDFPSSTNYLSRGIDDTNSSMGLTGSILCQKIKMKLLVISSLVIACLM